MGSCFSSTSTTTESIHAPSAKVVAPDGTLEEYAIPANVSDVLGSDSPSCFLCSSDKLFFDAHIPALHSSDLLEPDQIYFVLPNTKLDHPMSATDMVALAAKAGSAISSSSMKRGKGRRIPVAPLAEVPEGVGRHGEVYRFEDGRVAILRSRSIRKMAGTRRAAAARHGVLSRIYSRKRLSTIEEVAA